ncbi:hypothetical protein [Moraxella lacunata]
MPCSLAFCFNTSSFSRRWRISSLVSVNSVLVWSVMGVPVLVRVWLS